MSESKFFRGDLSAPSTLDDKVPCGYCNGSREEASGHDGRIVPCAYCTGDQAALHWPFTPKHDNCIECAREYEPPPSPVAVTVDAETLVDEVQHRMDQVVDAAVEWHQSEQQEWIEASEKLGAAIDSLLELRSAPAATPTSTEEGKDES